MLALLVSNAERDCNAALPLAVRCTDCCVSGGRDDARLESDCESCLVVAPTWVAGVGYDFADTFARGRYPMYFFVMSLFLACCLGGCFFGFTGRGKIPDGDQRLVCFVSSDVGRVR